MRYSRLAQHNAIILRPKNMVSHMTVYDIDLDQFQGTVIEASFTQTVLVDLWAEWCPPCISLSPILEQVVGEYDGRLRLVKIEVDEGENMKLAGRYGVRGFPTVILFQDGEERGRFSSMQSAGFVRDFIDSHMQAS